MACLDTSVLVDLLRPSRSGAYTVARAKIEELLGAGADIVTTRFNVAELWAGVAASREPEKEEAAMQALLEPVLAIDFDERSARSAGYLSTELRRRGTPIGTMDVLIAATCIVNRQPIVTRNARHFELVPGLEVDAYGDS